MHGIRDIPIQYLKSTNKYYLQYELFGQKVRFQAKFDNYEACDDNLFKINIEKIKLFYFFAEKRDLIKAYIKNSPALRVELYENEEKFGTLELELDEFKSDKVVKRDFFKMFSGKRVFPYLSWGLFISVGLYQSGNISTSSLKLANRDGLLIPEPEYHNADPLPEDWINMIREKEDRPMERLEFNSEASNSNPSHKPQSVKNIISQELEQYSRRHAPSAYESSRRKPYYS